MGITSITAARILEGQMERGYGEDHVLSWEKFPWSAQSKTYNVNSQSADSGACATAFLCGVKTNQGEHKYNSLGRAGQLRLLSYGDDRGTFWGVGGGRGLKFSIPGFFWVGKSGKYFFRWPDVSRVRPARQLQIVLMKTQTQTIKFNFFLFLSVKGLNPGVISKVG